MMNFFIYGVIAALTWISVSILAGALFSMVARKERRRIATNYILECRNNHYDWVKFIAENPTWRSELQAEDVVGDMQWHAKWIERHMLVLEALDYKEPQL